MECKEISPSSKIPSDSTEYFTTEYIDGDGFVAYDENNHKLFTIFTYDNGPDYISEGLFRITDNNKMGYANYKGEIVIQPIYDAALPFSKGHAAVCIGCILEADGEHSSWAGGKWGFINNAGEVVVPIQYDKIVSDYAEGIATVERDRNVYKIDLKENRIEMEDVNYKKWTRLLAEAVQLSNRVIFSNQLVIEINSDPEPGEFNFYDNQPGVIEINVKSEKDVFPLVTYTLIPWQSFSINNSDGFGISPLVLNNILTVTDFTIIYSSGIFPRDNEINYQQAVDFDAAFKKLINITENQNPEELEYLNIPEGVQLISYEVFPNHIKLQTALPGSRRPEHTEWENVSKDRMIYLQQIPEYGQKNSNWFKPSDPYYDTYYFSVEEDLLELFFQALSEADSNPIKREEIFTAAANKMRALFNAANSYVNFLYDKYERLLKNWLLISNDEAALPLLETMFGDYQPKLTPDSVIDYMPDIHDEYVRLPAPLLQNLGELLNLFHNYQKEAELNPGKWEEGNIILGANEKEYRASREELMLAEIGKLLTFIITENSPDDIKSFTDSIDIDSSKLKYNEFTFIHYDVMGSGRFFYIQNISESRLELP